MSRRAPCGSELAWASHRNHHETCDICETAHAERLRQKREGAAYQSARREVTAKLRRQNTQAARVDLMPHVDRTEGDWRMDVYSTRGPNTEKERRQPRVGDRRRIMAIQGNVCLYCGIPIGTIIGRQLKRSSGYIWNTTVTLRRNWDHFIPFAFLIQNPGANWVLACHVCNRVKNNRIFETVEDARRVVLPLREERGYESVRRVLGRLASDSTTAHGIGRQRGTEG